MTDHPRKDLAAVLKTTFPKWDVIDSDRNFDVKTKTVLIIKQRTIQRAPQAPQGIRLVGFVVTILSALADLDKAEDELDQTLPDLLEFFDAAAGIHWTDATKVVEGDSYLGYDVDIQVNTKREATP